MHNAVVNYCITNYYVKNYYKDNLTHLLRAYHNGTESVRMCGMCTVENLLSALTYRDRMYFKIKLLLGRDNSVGIATGRSGDRIPV